MAKRAKSVIQLDGCSMIGEYVFVNPMGYDIDEVQNAYIHGMCREDEDEDEDEDIGHIRPDWMD